jgi:hypothetical protein
MKQLSVTYGILNIRLSNKIAGNEKGLAFVGELENVKLGTKV